MPVLSYIHQLFNAVAYLLSADIISRLPPCRLNDTNQPVVSPRNQFSSPRPRLLACI